MPVVVGMPLLPLAGLAILFGAGLGAADLLGKRLPRQARAALAAPLSAAALVCASPLAQAGVRPVEIAFLILGPLALVTLIRIRLLGPTARRATVPVLLAVLAVGLSGAPSLGNRTWAVISFGNGDQYYWVSQAEALADGPVPRPASVHPDRVAYDLISIQHMPVGLPVGVAQVASLGSRDPSDAYEAFGSIIFALLAVSVFFVARGCLHWTSRLASVAGALVAANGYLLFASYYGWQAQLALTTFGLLAVMTLAICCDRKALGRERLLPAVFIAAGIATYGWVFSAFAGVGLAVALATGLNEFRSVRGRRRVAWSVGTATGLGLVLGLVPTVEAVRAFLLKGGNGQANAAELRAWSHYSWAFPSDAVGLIGRTIHLKSPGVGWTVLALAVTIALLALATTRIRAFGNPRGHVLAAACAALLIGLAVLALNGSSPYLSMKLMGYGAPFFTLFVLSTFVRRRPRTEGVNPVILLAALAGLFFCLTSFVSVAEGIRSTRPTTFFQGIEEAAAKTPRSSAIRIDYTDVWHQVWLIYFLRDRRLSVPKPTIYLHGVEDQRGRPIRFNAPAAYAIGTVKRRVVLARKNGMSLYALP
jgi:hypothetical protein